MGVDRQKHFIRMNGSIAILLLLAVLAISAAAPNHAPSEQEANIASFPLWHPKVPPFLDHRRTTKQPATTTTTTTTTTTHKPTTLKPTTLKPTTLKPTTLKPTTHKPSTIQSTTTTEETTTALPLFRGDYERLENFGYYKIYNVYSSWHKAWKTCMDDGSHLIVLRSQEEYDALRYWKPNYEVPGYSFYGVHHYFENHEFVTIFDEPLAETGYTKWSRDFSNKTLYNNQDYPDVIINLHPALEISDGLLLSYKRSSGYFICKMEI